MNEVATDYNAGFTSAVARLWLDYGGVPIAESQFPVAETRDTEFFVDAKVNSQGPRHMEIAARVHNHTAWPARASTQLKFRYWVDLTEVFAAGYTANDVTVSTAYTQGSGVTQLQVWGNAADNLYYTEVAFDGVDIYPGGQSASKKEVQFRLALPSNTNASEWDNTNDPSWDNYGAARVNAPKIALYDGAELVWGDEPGAGCGVTTGINCAPTASNASATAGFETSVDIALTGSDSDGTVTGFNIVTAPANGTVSIAGSNATYTPATGFFGTDSFTFEAVDDANATSSPATVTVDVEAPAIPTVSITSPATGDEVNTGATVNLTLNTAYISGVNVYVDGSLVVANSTATTIALTAPALVGNMAINVVALDASGAELNVSDSVTVAVKEKVIVTGVSCDITASDHWNTGFVLNPVTVTNNGTAAINGWTVSISFATPIVFVNGWNADLSAASSGLEVQASNVAWNGNLSAGQSAEFGFQGTHSGNMGAVSCEAIAN
jgi:hypothetical protein